ncbi:MAG TPA: hypothetical protein VIG93_00735 [Gaiellaceae bacterium]
MTAGAATRSALGPVRLGVVLTVVAAAVLAFTGLVDALGDFDARADHNASLSDLDRRYGVQGSPDLWPPREVIEDALATIPENATYRVVFGPEWRAGETRWTNELTAGFLRYFMFPRIQTSSTSAQWVLCFACADSALGGRFRVLSESDDGLRFGRVEG